MAEPIEVAIEKALLALLQAYCATNSIALSVPNRHFIIPTPERGAFWLRATLLPADTLSLGVDDGSSNRHSGIFQVDVFHSTNSGEYQPTRIAANVIELFKRGTVLEQDGFETRINAAPFRGRIRPDVDQAWTIISVSVPYVAFASNPA